MEKYGTVPPRFSKGWWEHIWFYHKFKIIGIAVAVLVVVISYLGVAFQTKYDLHISYMGNKTVTEETKEKLFSEIYPCISEVTGNDEKNIHFMQYDCDFTGYKENGTSGYNLAMLTKVSLEIEEGKSDLYLIDSGNFEILGSDVEAFMTISDYLKESYTDDMLIKDDSGRAYAISVKNSTVLNGVGLDTTDMYLAVRQLYPKNVGNSERELNHKNSLAAAELIVG